jgi:acyl carrier protein
MGRYMSTAIEKLRQIITETEDVFVRIPVENISGEEKIKEDLGIDSLGRVNLFYEISDDLGTDDDEEVCANWNTVADIVKYIEENNS